MIKRLIALIILLLLVFLVLLFLYPLPGSIHNDWSQAVYFRDGQPMRFYLTSDEKWRIRTRLEDVPSLMLKATLCYEDRYFQYHPGVNPFSILRASWQNTRAGKIVSGGSTITMQLARLLEPRPRTVLSKAKEVFRAFQLELRLGKRAILEEYLSRVPYGGNYEGITAASRAYFGKTPENLRPEEVAYLVSLPQSPSRRYLEKTQEARNRILARMQSCGLITLDEYRSAHQLPIPNHLYPYPFFAPHAADYLRDLYASRKEIHTAIDRTIQEKVGHIAQSHKPRIFASDASNASIVVIENKTREVIALLGSLDYWDEENDGQVIGFVAPRSPGSALKPFLYALAIQEGIITTESLIEDAPVRFGGFRPANYSETYEGLVRAEGALVNSLNVPFIHILRHTGLKNFLRLLEDGGLFIRPDIPYGLSVITGGVEVNLLELANLYTTLARNGYHAPYRLLKDDPNLKELSILDPAAVALTRKGLAIHNRPDAPLLGDFTFPADKVYWKTGTSWGFRDAWSIGFNAKYTVGVWVGNFSGRASKGIVGANLAAPIMFDILQAITSLKEDLPPPASSLFSRIQVCSYSGYRPTPYCPETKEVLVVKDAAPKRECPFHQAFLVEKKSGYRACLWRSYREGEIVFRSFTILPPNVATVLGIPDRTPPFSPGCSLESRGDTLRILAPTPGASYFFTEGIRQMGGIPLQAFTSTPDSLIHWFVNNRYIGSTRSGDVKILSPSSGIFRILATNSIGEKEGVDISISNP